MEVNMKRCIPLFALLIVLAAPIAQGCVICTFPEPCPWFLDPPCGECDAAPDGGHGCILYPDGDCWVGSNCHDGFAAKPVTATWQVASVRVLTPAVPLDDAKAAISVAMKTESNPARQH
jgi:hypothetical protein